MSLQPNKETLSFKIGLSGTYWDKKPQYAVLINDSKIASGLISEASDAIEYITFTCDLEEDTQHKLSIRLENKADEDTVKNPPVGDPFIIEKDMLLNIHSIEIDDINLENLIWSISEFIPEDNTRPILKNCINLGWNGTYVLNFTVPFYIWLLENM